MQIENAQQNRQDIKPWLMRLHPGLYAIPLGLYALSGAWGRLEQWQSSSISIALPLLMFASLILICLFVLSSVKYVRYPSLLRLEFHHPIISAMLALMPVTILLACTLLLPYFPSLYTVFLSVTLLCLSAQAVLAWRVVSQLSTGQMPVEAISPALYLPIVPGGFVGAMCLYSLSLPGFSMMLLGMGLGGWALLEVRILNRLFSGPLPLALRPTLGIEIAPAAVGSLAITVLWPELSANMIMIGIGITCGPLFAVLTRWRWWSETPFSFSFWSFSFPLAALASIVIEAVRRGSWPLNVAYAVLILVSLIIAFLSLRSLLLLVQKRLLPP
jgi:tellurite resistance protein